MFVRRRELDLAIAEIHALRADVDQAIAERDAAVALAQFRLDETVRLRNEAIQLRNEIANLNGKLMQAKHGIEVG